MSSGFIKVLEEIGADKQKNLASRAPAQSAAPEPDITDPPTCPACKARKPTNSSHYVFEAVCQFVRSCGFACEVCADPQNHPDAKGGRGYGGHAQLLTRRRIAISPEVETLHGAAHEVAHQLAEERWGNFHNESQVAACSLWELERWALDLVCSPKRSLGAQGDADPYHMAEYAASWAHDYSVAYRPAAPEPSGDPQHEYPGSHQFQANYWREKCQSAEARLAAVTIARDQARGCQSDALGQLAAVRAELDASTADVFEAKDEAALLRVLQTSRQNIRALLTGPRPGAGEETL